ncbi:MAG: class I SAM-dependent methyltransferase, partial [Deltaproteobacteria bacterium]|nr:class I SAM-dependent methyltransferase [Deltaproteobacteria bacterium]
LELGCGDGGNIIPLAIAHPHSSFVGVDLAKVHIDTGTALAGELGIGNLRLEACSFVDFEDEAGGFDYIIVHGLMSWVTPNLQALLFATCKRLLAPTGVAFISYNTYPGWFMQHSIRQLLRHHNRDVEDGEVVLERSRQLLDVLIQTVPEAESAYRDYLESVGAVARNPERKFYFAHEYLEDENHPFYVRDFIERAGQHGLQYLADADLVDMELDNMPSKPADLLEAIAEDRSHRLQILDFAVNRKFRQSLLCHAEQRVRDQPDLARVEEMYVESSLDPAVSDPDIESVGTLGFNDRQGRTIEVDQPIVKAALIRFCEESRQPIAFEALLDWARQRIAATVAPGSDQDLEEREVLAVILGRVHLADMVGLRASPPCWALEAGERPKASPLTRLCATRGQPTISLRHRQLALDNQAVCDVLELLDGTRDRAQVLAHFEGQLSAEELAKILDLSAHNAVLMKG